MNTDETQILNKRIIKVMRGLMAAWAKRWRVIRREHEVGTRGQEFIEHAKRCRNIAARWSKSSS